jgi:phage shock protein A
MSNEYEQLGGVYQWVRRESYRNEVLASERRTAMENALRALQAGEPELARRILTEALRR